MPHRARTKSESGFYHVVTKGIADQLIFESDVDRRYYLQLLKEGVGEAAVTVHAYCLMSNHVHLVVQASGDSLASFMKYVDERYGRYFADKIGRRGGILRKPFWSEPIETDEYLLCAVRYVHANPAVAGICAASAYEWSSAKDYLGRAGVADPQMVLSMCGGRDGFVRFSREEPGSCEAFSGSRLRNHLTDEEALRSACLTIGEAALRSIGKLQRDERNDAIRALKRAGIPGRQIARVTGLGRHVIHQA